MPEPCVAETRRTVRTEEIYALAVELEAEELIGGSDDPLSADDVFPVLELLWERGVDLSDARLSARVDSDADSQAVEET